MDSHVMLSNAWLCAGHIEGTTVFVPATFAPEGEGWQFNLQAPHSLDVVGVFKSGSLYTFATPLPSDKVFACLGQTPYYGALHVLEIAERVRGMGSLDELAVFHAQQALGDFLDDLLLLIPSLSHADQDKIRGVLRPID